MPAENDSSSSMNLIMFQDTKLIYRYLLLFYTLITKYQKDKIYHHIKRNKISRNKPP